jgi:uncharacterized Zn finger protein (UPF0148 family)
MFGFRSYIDVLSPSCPDCHAVLIKNPKERHQSMCPICGLIPEEEVIQKMEAEQYKPGLSAKINPINKGSFVNAV